jgi:hypothetical protein
MAKEYTQEQLWKLYQKLPDELKEAIFSSETADDIYDICLRNGIEDDRISEIARYTGRVLLGILPLDEFQKTLEKEIKLEEDKAKKVAREIDRFIFYPVKTSLEEIYKIEIAPPAKPKVTPPPKPPEEKPKAPPKEEDVYREPIE